MSKTREQFPLSRRKIIKKTIGSTILLVVILAIMSIGFVVIAPRFIAFFGMIILIFVLVVILISYLYQWWYFSVYFYDLTPDFIQIRKGPITPREITIPYERIQDVYVDQDILDRILGLYDVHLSSATAASGMAAHIDGVGKQAADGLRATLLQTVKERISKK